MKLVRLESEEENLTESQFTNNLSIAVQLDENAKVALKTITMELEAPAIIINSTNDIIKFGIGGSLNRTVNITHGSYTISTLTTEIEDKLNIMTQSYEATDDLLKLEIGSEWLCQAFLGASTTKLYFEIAYEAGDEINLTDAQVVGNMQYDAGDFVKAPGTDDDTYNAYLQSDKYMCKGGWDTSIQLIPQVEGQPQDIKDSEWILSLGEILIADLTDKDEIIDNSFVCIMRNIEGNYSYKKNGVMIATDIPIENEDTIYIDKKLNGDSNIKVSYRIIKGTETEEFEGDDLLNLDMDDIRGPNYLTLKVGNDTGKIMFSNLKYTPSSSNVELNGVYTQKQASDIKHVIKNINIKAQPRDVLISFWTRQLSSLLGYEQLSYIKNGISMDYKAEKEVRQDLFKNDLIIEIPELNLNTYDQSYKQKRNIIMVIPAGDLKNAVTARGFSGYELSYTDVYPTFISLQNKQMTLTYPQLSVRVTSQKQLLKTYGKMSTLILFKDVDDI